MRERKQLHIVRLARFALNADATGEAFLEEEHTLGNEPVLRKQVQRPISTRICCYY
jgi:hypothetical protein